MANKVNQRLPDREITRDNIVEWAGREAHLVIEKIRRALNEAIDEADAFISQPVTGKHLARFRSDGSGLEDAGTQLLTREIGGRRVVFLNSTSEPADESVPDGSGVAHIAIAETRPLVAPTGGQSVWNDEDFGLSVLGEDGQLATIAPPGQILGDRTQFHSIKFPGQFLQPSVPDLQTLTSFGLGIYGREVRNGTLLVRGTAVAFSTAPGGEDPDPPFADALELVACIRVDEDGIPDVFGVEAGNSGTMGIIGADIFANPVIDTSGSTVRLRSEVLSTPSVTLIYSTFEVFGFHAGPVSG